MYKVYNFEDNDDVSVIDESGPFKVVEYARDLSVSPLTAQVEWFSSKMNIRRRQVVCDLDGDAVTLQAGAMQWILGDVDVRTDIQGAGDLARKLMRGAVTKESAVKPVYSGCGKLALEPTYRHIVLMDIVKSWGGGVVLDDGLFLACDSRIQMKTVARSTISSAVAGNQGLFNACLYGDDGVFCLESPVPKEELMIVDLDNDVLKIDGALALAWSPSLRFTVERTTKTLTGSAASGEGLVNVYRGSGRVMMTPVSSRTAPLASSVLALD